MLYQRFAAMAAVLLLLGGCSFFDFFWDQPETPAEGPKIDGQGLGGPLEGAQLAALPGYQSDRDVAPARIEAIRGFVGSPIRRPDRRPVAAVQLRPIKRRLTFKDLLPGQPVLELQPISADFETGSHSLAELISDQNWRKRTSETLNRLFQ